jgi:hypothetical protein
MDEQMGALFWWVRQWPLWCGCWDLKETNGDEQVAMTFFNNHPIQMQEKFNLRIFYFLFDDHLLIRIVSSLKNIIMQKSSTVKTFNKNK